MANVVLFNPTQYLKSVNTPDYENNPNAIINPDISSVQSVPLKYWKRSGNIVVEMTTLEKQAVDQAELQTRKSFADNFGIDDMKIVLTALIKVLNTKLPANKQIVKQEVVDAIKAEIT